MICIGCAIILVVGFLHFKNRSSTQQVSDQNPPASGGPVFDTTVSDGTIIVSYPSLQYGLATNRAQVLVTSYIPPCDEGFSYCLYATSSAYKGTNFESAGIRIQKRTDLAAERACLNTPPAGFDASVKPDASTSTGAYASSKFAQVGDAGAGHYANGSLYRLFYRKNSSCYEFETRIGESQFMNYPAGTIKEFTVADREAVQSQLVQILDKVTLLSGDTHLFAF
ncbi:MAG: hypothetical protein JWO00_407 [Candidatus Parcubacteria bacterium]|nr:hypothetical protein [Candidatus Parcubacteria bacterium]